MESSAIGLMKLVSDRPGIGTTVRLASCGAGNLVCSKTNLDTALTWLGHEALVASEELCVA